MTTTTADAQRLRTIAADAAREAQDSFDRSDTDGCFTQQANANLSELAAVQATIAENDGYAEFQALFDLDGNLLPAKLVRGQYGMTWLMLDPASVDGRGDSHGIFISPSKAESDVVRRRNNARKGVYVGRVKVKAFAMHSTGDHEAFGFAGLDRVHTVVLREDRGFSRDAIVVDNGH